MTTLDPRTAAGVAHIARLSRLALTAAEAEAMARHMGKILDAVAALDRLDTAGVSAALHDCAPSGHSDVAGSGASSPPPSEGPTLRPDVIVASLPVEVALQNAPRRGPAGFEVPSVLAE